MLWKRFKNSTKPRLVQSELGLPVVYNLRRDGFTQSMLRNLQHCQRSLYLSLRLWESTRSTLKYANGTITHEILDRCYKSYIEHQCIPSVLQIKKWIYGFDKEFPEWMPQSKPEWMEQYKAVCYVMITEYLRYYKKDFVPNRLVGAEDEFNISLMGYRARGKKDLRVDIADERWVFETKTMARIIEQDLLLSLPFNVQNLLYVIAEEEEFKVKVRGVIYNIIRNPGQKFRSDETLKQYCIRLRKEVRRNQKHFFKRYEIPYTNSDKIEFRKELKDKLTDLELLTTGRRYPYKNENNCVNPFRCPYLSACSSKTLAGYSQTKILFKELS